MSSEIAIKVEKLSKCFKVYDRPRDRILQAMPWNSTQRYREFWALKDVTFEVKKGETVGIIGRNGSGKSTLLQMICGTLTPTSGTIQTYGRVAALLELGAGFNPEFTGRENVYMNASILGLTKEETDARFDEIAAFADIGHFIEQPVKSYSSGMFVRLAFSVIAHVDADILVVDEALSVGDAFFVQKCMRFLRRFMDSGTVLFVSHDTGAILNLCKTAVWLNKGYSEFQGTPKEATERYLAALHEPYQGEGIVAPANQGAQAAQVTGQGRDMRLDFINTTQYRNDIKICAFAPDAADFGRGGAVITSVQMLDQEGRSLDWVVGGENVQLDIHCLAHICLNNPVAGFIVKDRLGQHLFGDNTQLTYCNSPLAVSAGQKIVAHFKFCMPILPVGDYSITVAIAESVGQEYVQHHWIHDALLLTSHSSSVCTGLIGIQMSSISISIA